MTDETQIEKATEVAHRIPDQLTMAEQTWRLDERKAAVLGRASEAVPKAFRGKPGDIMAVWLMGDELGISRMAMLRGAYVVNGKPQLSGDLLLAVARGNGVKVTETNHQDDDTGELWATCIATLPGGEEISVTFTQGDAVAAGLWGSSDPWKKYPRRMLQMRARGWCLRDAIPDKLAGVYVEGELDSEMRDITPQDPGR
jgi:hypothetical protein